MENYMASVILNKVSHFRMNLQTYWRDEQS